MLALINELRNIIGRRGFFAFLILAVLSVVAFDLIMNSRGYFEAYIQAQKAHWAALEAQAVAEKAKADAAAAAAIAANSAQLQKGTAAKAEGEGAVSIARTPYADKLAEQELRQRTAEADLKEAEAARARAEKERAQAETRRAKIAA